MKAIRMENLGENKALDSQGLAAVTFVLRWSDARAEHEDEMHVEKFSVWREADFLPAAIGPNIPGMHAGDCAEAALSAGEATGSWDAGLQISGSTSGFDRTYRRGLDVEPRVGRFYPQGFFHGFPEIVREAVAPARITQLDAQGMQVDLNHPLARQPLKVTFAVEKVLPGSDIRGGRCSSPIDDLVRYPGLAAPLQDGKDTDYGADGQGMMRMDGRDDAVFYASPRMVQHLDARALETINALYRRLIPADADVLDLMASYDSHLQGCSPGSLHVLGMNADELQANRSATARLVQDLNHQPALPFEDASLDAVVCTASVEYLVQPHKILAEALRVLRPGGILVTAFSNRWFPTKAIQVWSELHEFERVGMVTQWLQHAGFAQLHTFSSRGWPRPADDAHAGETALSDPVYAVWGYKPAV
ncbi:MAG: methyltransferase domain-containing protein [Gammaproteobacteria bacterium]|jgi:SAM-dependent methyltransferase